MALRDTMSLNAANAGDAEVFEAVLVSVSEDEDRTSSVWRGQASSAHIDLVLRLKDEDAVRNVRLDFTSDRLRELESLVGMPVIISLSGGLLTEMIGPNAAAVLTRAQMVAEHRQSVQLGLWIGLLIACAAIVCLVLRWRARSGVNP